MASWRPVTESGGAESCHLTAHAPVRWQSPPRAPHQNPKAGASQNGKGDAILTACTHGMGSVAALDGEATPKAGEHVGAAFVLIQQLPYPSLHSPLYLGVR